MKGVGEVRVTMIVDVAGCDHDEIHSKLKAQLGNRMMSAIRNEFAKDVEGGHWKNTKLHYESLFTPLDSLE